MYFNNAFVIYNCTGMAERWRLTRTGTYLTTWNAILQRQQPSNSTSTLSIIRFKKYLTFYYNFSLFFKTKPDNFAVHGFVYGKVAAAAQDQYQPKHNKLRIISMITMQYYIYLHIYYGFVKEKFYKYVKFFFKHVDNIN